MEDLKNKIEEASKQFGKDVEPNGIAVLQDVYAEMWIRGAKSTEAKEYWQQGMYTEEEVEELFCDYRQEFVLLSNLLYIDFLEWFEQNKKK